MFSRIRSTLPLAALALAIGLGAASCGDPAVVDGKTVVKVLAYADNSQKSGADFKLMVEKFEADNPDIKIVYDALYDEAYFQKATARIAAGDVPDVAYLGADERWASIWQTAGLLVDHRPWLDGDFYDIGLIPPMGPNGEIWEIPFGTANVTTVLYCNKLLLEKYGAGVPKTYEDLVALVEPARKDGIEVIAMGGATPWVWNSCLLSALIPRFSGEAGWVGKAVKGEYKFTDKPFVDSLKFIKRMLDDGVLSPSTILTDDGSATAKFGTEKSLFLLQGQWATGTIDPWVSEDTAMIPFPDLPGQAAAMSGSVAAAVQTGYGITKKGASHPKVKEAALKFIKYYSSTDYAMEKLLNGAIMAPILKGFTVDPDEVGVLLATKVKFAQDLKIFTDVVDAFLPRRPNDILNAGMQAIATGQMTPEQVAEATEKDLREFQAK